MQRTWRAVVLWLGIAAMVLPLRLGATTPAALAGAQLKASELESVASQGSVALLGFAWKGEARLFDDELTLADVSTPEPGDLDFRIVAKGGTGVCEGLRKMASQTAPLRKARLRFKVDGGPGASFRLEGLSVEQADCAARPWSASLRAESVSAGEAAPGKEKTKGGKGDKKEREGV